MATVQPPTTQLEFHQAMADFKTMFPDMDDEVIEAVLRANQGAVDATIDQLLAMSTDNENEKLRNEMEKKETLIPSTCTTTTTTIVTPPPSLSSATTNTITTTVSSTTTATTTTTTTTTNTTTTTTEVDQEDSIQLSSTNRSPQPSPQHTSSEVPLRTVRGWAPPLLGPLPDDFLRVIPPSWSNAHKKQLFLETSCGMERLQYTLSLFLQPATCKNLP